MDYNETLNHLFSRLPMFSRVGGAAYKPGLERVERLAAHFGHPERKFRSIHVGGTNGKGSCSHMIAAVLQEAGYKTGLYTSPHLVDFRERMRIDGKMIPEQDVVDFVQRFLDSGYEGEDPSFFELTMMMAFDLFAREHVDYAVIEVGMGGRLDSTNIITPEMCVVTNISKDHTQFLGETPEQIASEKAGIIKTGIPVVIGEAEGAVKQVFATRAQTVDAPIMFAQERDLPLHRDADGLWCGTIPGTGLTFRSPLEGEYQKHNIRTVLTAVDTMRLVGIGVTPEQEARGLENVVKLTGLMGRWTVLQDSPKVICDTGHNVAGLTDNMKRLAALPHRRLRMVIGFVADKDIDHILQLLPRDAEYYLTNAQIPRALPVEKLAEKIAALGLSHTSHSDVATAYRTALADASPDDLIYVGGSTFIVADLLASLG